MTDSKGRWPKTDPDSGVEDAVLLILEWLGEQGVGAMIRVDAERFQAGLPVWTFTAGGGPLARGMRADGASAGECLSRGLIRLREGGLTVPF
ncbi:hypothetical protein [Streptomyces sp. NRRL S-920]|uniref:hypothetical protein n=1 Tax=Streptomyces sp. NRRL S-920 TaxID=1463921 RepID=UPI000997EEF8|nr:hypothetical protein [Streptomyces sp. NRRL S-920]